MIFNNDLIFIHIGKTGGMSCAEYLLHNLTTPIYNCHEEAASEQKRLKLSGTVIPRTDVHRHCTLEEALAYIQAFQGRSLTDFQQVVAVIRHPYTLEYSFYHHLQKPDVRRRRQRNTRLLALADGDFADFVRYAGHHRDNLTQDAFVRVGEEIPDKVMLVRFAQLAEDFPQAVAPFVRSEANYPFPYRNFTRYEKGMRRQIRDLWGRVSGDKAQVEMHRPNLEEVLTEEVKELIYEKHRFMFESGLYSADTYGATEVTR